MLRSRREERAPRSDGLFGLTLIDLQLEDDMEAILPNTRANGGAPPQRWSALESRQTDPS
jgi:hypothetical protein